MRESVRDKPKLFLTFAESDLAMARPVAAQLRRHGGLTLDYAVPSEPFAAQRSYLIRASLALRIQRCTVAVCLFGAQTLKDDWVRWSLAAAHEMNLTLLGAPLSGTSPRQAEDLLAGLGVEVVALSTDTIAQRFAPSHQRSPVERESPLALALRIMRHPLH